MLLVVVETGTETLTGNRERVGGFEGDLDVQFQRHG